MRQLIQAEAGNGYRQMRWLSASLLTIHHRYQGAADPDLHLGLGEQRLSGFLLWQAAYSEIVQRYYWPAFRYIDFLRALREYRNAHADYPESDVIIMSTPSTIALG